eukprot:7564986-Alexandrium_andersonii.AAC.1
MRKSLDSTTLNPAHRDIVCECRFRRVWHHHRVREGPRRCVDRVPTARETKQLRSCLKERRAYLSLVIIGVNNDCS